MSAPRRSARIAEKAAKQTIPSTKKPAATLSEVFPNMKIFIAEPVTKSSNKYLSIMDSLGRPVEGFTPLMHFSDSPYRTLCLAVDGNEFVLCIEYISSDDEDLSRYQYEPLQRFSYEELEHRCINPLDDYKYTDDAKFLNRFFGEIHARLPLLKKHVPEPEKYAQSAMEEARRLAAQNAPIVESKPEPPCDCYGSLTDIDGKITVKRLHAYLQWLMESEPATANYTIEHSIIHEEGFGGLVNTRWIFRDVDTLIFAQHNNHC